MMEYKHTAEMGEISGFGGGYEATCQNMLHAGVSWIMQRREAEIDTHLEISTVQNCTGLIFFENDQAKELESILLAAADGDCTGAMMEAVAARIFYIAGNSWEEYCTQCTKLEDEEQNETPPKNTQDGPPLELIEGLQAVFGADHVHVLETPEDVDAFFQRMFGGETEH